MTEVTNEDLLETLVKLSNTVHGKLNVLQHHVEIIDMRLKTSPPPVPPDPPEPPGPIMPHLPRVTMKKNAPLMEISNYDGKNKPPEKRKPVLRLHKYGLLKRGRIIAKKGKELIVLGSERTANGIAYILYSGQEVDGKYLTATNTKARIPGSKPKRIDKYFRILKTKVKV